jgi:lysylphosphatidylglycerol synthetase-like protein (DUF2156 family)
MLFSMSGILFFSYTLATRGNAIYLQHSLWLKNDVWWAVLLLFFGLVMLLRPQSEEKHEPLQVGSMRAGANKPPVKRSAVWFD